MNITFRKSDGGVKIYFQLNGRQDIVFIPQSEWDEKTRGLIAVAAVKTNKPVKGDKK